MTKLNQIIAVEKGVKNQALRAETDLYHALDKKGLFAGLSRVYTPKDEEDGDRLPPESVQVQLKAEEIIDELTTVLQRLFDVIATKDEANTRARANIVVDGETLATDVPVTTLMFLEKQLEALNAFVARLPILDPTQRWFYDRAVGCFASAEVQTTKTKKVPRNHVLAEATKEHPAQVQVYHEDVIVGTWAKTEFSGALENDRVDEIKSRLDRLVRAVKFAREEANTIDVTDVKIGASLLNYLFPAPLESHETH